MNGLARLCGGAPVLAIVLALGGVLFGGCQRNQAERMVIGELRRMEQVVAMNPTQQLYHDRLTDAHERLSPVVKGMDPKVLMELQRALAWYTLAGNLMAGGEAPESGMVQKCWAEGRLQTDWLEQYFASGNATRDVMMTDREKIRTEEKEKAMRAADPWLKAFGSPLRKDGKPEPFFSQKQKAPAATPAPALPRVTPAPVRRQAAIVLTQPYEARLQFGKVKLAVGTRLNVIANDGTTVTAQYGGERIAIPAGVTRDVE